MCVKAEISLNLSNDPQGKFAGAKGRSRCLEIKLFSVANWLFCGQVATVQRRKVVILSVTESFEFCSKE